MKKSTQEKLAQSLFYKVCIFTRYSYRDVECEGRIEWHHNVIYANRQIDEPIFILPLCHFHHEQMKRSRDCRMFADMIMYLRLFHSTDLLSIHSKQFPKFDFETQANRAFEYFPELKKEILKIGLFLD